MAKSTHVQWVQFFREDAEVNFCLLLFSGVVLRQNTGCILRKSLQHHHLWATCIACNNENICQLLVSRSMYDNTDPKRFYNREGKWERERMSMKRGKEHQQWQWESNNKKNNWFLGLHHPPPPPPPPPPSIPPQLSWWDFEKQRTINQPWPQFYIKRSWRCRINSGSTFLFVF